MEVFRNMTKEKRQELQAEIIRLFEAGCSDEEVFKITGTTKKNLKDMRKRDQVFDWHIRKALEKNK